MNNVIELQGVTKMYGMDSVTVPALKGINLKIMKGTMYAIIGPSGSGKSTLMNLIGLLDTPTQGKILYDGKDVSDFNEDELADLRGKRIGFVFQLFNLIPTLTAAENVELPMLFQNKEREEVKKRVAELLELVKLTERAHHRPSELSGGQQQRVAIARALAMDPDIILADEPTGNLDSKTGAEIMDLLETLHEKKGKTIILITHDKVIADYAHEVIRLKDGVIVDKQENHKR